MQFFFVAPADLIISEMKTSRNDARILIIPSVLVSPERQFFFCHRLLVPVLEQHQYKFLRPLLCKIQLEDVNIILQMAANVTAALLEYSQHRFIVGQYLCGEAGNAASPGNCD